MLCRLDCFLHGLSSQVTDVHRVIVQIVSDLWPRQTVDVVVPQYATITRILHAVYDDIDCVLLSPPYGGVD